MASFCGRPPCAGFDQRAPSSALTGQAQYPLVRHGPSIQRVDDSTHDLEAPLWMKVEREYTHILQPSGRVFFERFCSETNVLRHDLEVAGRTYPHSFNLKNFRGHCDSWEEVACGATLAFVLSCAGVPDNIQLNVDRSTLLKAWSQEESWLGRLFYPGHLSSNHSNYFRKLTFDLANSAGLLKHKVAPSVVAIAEDEIPLSHLTASTMTGPSTHDKWSTIHQYAIKCRQKCDLAAENLDGFRRGIDGLICTLEEWKTFASPLGALPHVDSARGHFQMNEVIRSTVSWIRSVQLTVQVLGIAHSTAGQIACDLVNREHSGGWVHMGIMDAAPDRCDPNVVGQDDVQVNSDPLIGIDMETSFDMNVADALTGSGLKDPDKAAFDTSRNARKLGEDQKQMKAVIQFKDKLGQLQKTGQVTVWNLTNQVYISRPRKPLLIAMARAIVKSIGVTKDERVTGPGERYAYMATDEPFDLKSVIFKSARLLPCLKVIEVKLQWPDDAKFAQ